MNDFTQSNGKFCHSNGHRREEVVAACEEEVRGSCSEVLEQSVESGTFSQRKAVLVFE